MPQVAVGPPMAQGPTLALVSQTSSPLETTIAMPVSFYAWAILALLTGIAIVVSSGLDVWDTKAKVGPWAIGGPTATWGIFFALWCGTNYGVLASLQCWPFSRVRQPWGTTLAVLGVVVWCALITLLLQAVYGAVFANHDTALLEAQVYGWHLVFWSFCA